jgi:hypothetical protein
VLLKRPLSALIIIPKQIMTTEAHEPAPKWRRILNVSLATLSGLIAGDMVLCWGIHFLIVEGNNLLTDSPATQLQVRTITLIVSLLSFLLSIYLGRWQWKRSPQTSNMQEKMMTGAWMLLCIVLLMRPRF